MMDWEEIYLRSTGLWNKISCLIVSVGESRHYNMKISD